MDAQSTLQYSFCLSTIHTQYTASIAHQSHNLGFIILPKDTLAQQGECDQTANPLLDLMWFLTLMFIR